ncbi:Acid stress-induced BolA-like protein IbaG/YrbA, predicted regulator of iron metabolism [Marinospirillum celere]|uniref:Acid stress-induced BolA-like protein IbaG/YrbA, predicted regulator of iron metabolism n=1 Tax=Marinospirillum celere TaxID=1122252 RepID=A0A1I1G4H1_9GAMM|nr:BolA/IbaG family iron-sulfur metabolism protein [Marinospirillum celere]SFC04080.1 Acid stress-induced BolA-like protein IbaG/YrbA, predicted regulator of iron metabolism [Marinospirillum celere]
MQANELKALLESRLPQCEFIVQGDDGQHFQVIAISDAFTELKTPVKKQQLVMSQLSEEIASNQVHAVALKTYTPDEWAKVKDLQVG